MASTVGFAGRNLPPPQSPFVETNRNLSYDGYSFLLDLLNTSSPALAQQTVDNAVVAAGATQATATQLSKNWSVIRSGSGGVLLAVSQPGQRPQVVFNQSGGNRSVYPPPGFAIDALGANVAFTLNNSKMQVFSFVSTTQILSMQLG